jgi:hypothetical protein
MPIEDIIAEKAGPNALAQQERQRATNGSAQTRRTATPDASLQIGRNDLMVALQVAELVVLLLILTKL